MSVTVGAAIEALARVCDGAASLDGSGFNKFDASYVRSLQSWGLDRLTPRQEAAAYRMLKKYVRQLSGFGIDYNDIVVREDKPEDRHEEERVPRPVQSRMVKIDGSNFVLTFNYDFNLKEEVKKTFVGARFQKDPARWLVSILGNESKMLEFAEKNGFAMPEKERVHGMKAALESNEIASRAEHSDFQVDGLGITLRPFQAAGVEYAIKNQRVMIADQMGLGKTIEALATLQAQQSFPALVICPASLKYNWQNECRKVLGKTAAVLNGRMPVGEFDIYIVNYDQLKKWAEVLETIKFEAIIIDESHYCKNSKAQRSKLVDELASRVKTRLLLTGTPIVNRPVELVHQLKIMGRLDDFGGAWKFMMRYCGAEHNGFGWDFNGATNLEELNRKLRSICYIRREKEQVLKELPPFSRETVYVPADNMSEIRRAEDDIIRFLTEAQEKRMAEMVDLTEDERAEYEKKAAAWERAETLVRITTLRKLVAQGKIAAAKEWIENFIESGQKLVVFSWHIEVQQALLANFANLNPAHVMGSDDAMTRQAQVDRFQSDPNCRLIICSIVAAGEGITLTAASNVVFIEHAWTPGKEDQAAARIDRIGQKYPTTAWYLDAEDTIDATMTEILGKKREIIKAAAIGNDVDEEAGTMGQLVKSLINKRS